MGIFELAKSGSNLTRQTVSVTNSPSTGELVALSHSYILLNVTVNNPCRIRLYSDSTSLTIDEPRPTLTFDVLPAVGLITDTVITSQSYTLNFDPPIIGATYDGSTWYNISGSDVTATFTYYPIEFSYESRETMTISTNLTLAPGTTVEGNITSPKSFLILSASCTHPEVRLRLYSRDVSTISQSERSRQFGTIPSDQSSLIADMMFDSALYGYKLTPILQAYNLSNLRVGENFVGYILQNVSPSTSLADITASIYVYPVED